MKTVLCFGDSNTYGYVPGTGERYDRKVRWTGRLQNLLGSDYCVVEEGLNGRTTAFDCDIEPYRNGLDTILPCVMSHAPVELVILMLGTNDTKCRYHVSPTEIGYGLEELIMKVEGYHQFRAQKPRILVVCPVPMSRSVGESGIEFDISSVQKSEALPAVFQDTAALFGAAYFDVRKAVSTSALGCDGIHFSPEAHAAMAQAMAQQVRQLLSEDQ